MRNVRMLAVVLALAVATASAAAAAGAEIASDQLVYQGVEVKTQVDVNGEAAMQLIGGILDAAAAQAQEQAKAMKESGKPAEGPLAMLPAVAPMVDPAKEAIKSLSRVTILVMRAKGPVEGADFLAYYSGLLSPFGWSPLLTVRDQGNTTVSIMLAREAKGLFFAVNGKNEMVVGLVTTTKPLGELLGQIASAGGGSLPAILSLRSMGQKKAEAPAPPAPPTPEKPKASPKKAK